MMRSRIRTAPAIRTDFAARRISWSILFALLFCARLGDHGLEAVELGRVELVGHAEERASGTSGRPIEKSLHHVAERSLASDAVGNDRAVEKAAIRFAALNETLVLKALEHRAHRRTARLVRERFANVRHGHLPPLVEQVHDLTFSWRQLIEHYTAPFALHL